MSWQLRPYQQKVIAEVYRQIRAGKKRILIFAPTGAGKTIISSQIVAHAAGRNRKILFVVHRDILVKQTYEKFKHFKIDCGFIKAGYEENKEAIAQIASVQTLASRDWWHQLGSSVILLDEAHLTAWATVTKKMIGEIFPDGIYIGLTATPWRLRKDEGMADIFEAIVSAPMPFELIESGFLVKPSYYGVSIADLEKVKIKNGEYDEGQLSLIFDRPEQIEQIVAEWKRLGSDRRTIVFAVNVEHSKNIFSGFEGAGIAAAHVDGSTPIKQREKIYQQLATGEISILSSCMTLTEGFDVPAVNGIILARPTLSKALYFQMVGRGLRLSPDTDKHDCLVLDFAGNVERHGFIEDLRAVSLEESHCSCGGGEAPYKICPRDKGGCGAIIYSFYQKCPSCGYNFDLQKIIVQLNLTQQLRSEDLKLLEQYREDLKIAFEKQRSPGWAAMRFKDRHGYFPPDDWAKGAVFGENYTKEQQSCYQKQLGEIAARLSKEQKWIDRYLKLEFSEY